MRQTYLENRYKEHAGFFLKETERIMEVLRKSSTKFDIYQTRDGVRNLYIFEQEIKTFVAKNLIVPDHLRNEYPLPYVLPNIIAGMIQEKILDEPETFIVD